jgi:hypothetical protein
MKSLLRSVAAIPNYSNCKLRATDSLDQVCGRRERVAPIRGIERGKASLDAPGLLGQSTGGCGPLEGAFGTVVQSLAFRRDVSNSHHGTRSGELAPSLPIVPQLQFRASLD